MWTYVKDKLPETNMSVYVLVTTTDGRVQLANFTKFWDKNGEFTDPYNFQRTISVIAWMYLPTAAKPLQYCEETVAIKMPNGSYTCEACGCKLKDGEEHCGKCGRIIDWRK